jgi:hypothetical protein
MPAVQRSTRSPRLLHDVESNPRPLDWKETISQVTTLLSFLAIGLYGAVRFGQQVFCNRLGITPEAIGLTYANTISRAAVVIAAITSAWALAYSTYIVVDRPSPKESSWKRRTRILVNFSTFVLGAILMAVLMYSFWLVGGFIGAVVAFVSWLAMPAVKFFIRRSGRIHDGGAASRAQSLQSQPNISLLEWLRQRPAASVMIVSLITAVAFLLAGGTADIASEQVQKGGNIRVGSGFGVLGLHAERIQLSGSLPSGFDTSNLDLRYLGRADGIIVFYDVANGGTILVPEDGIIVEYP